MTTGKLLGIDHGLVRLGVAVSDASRLVARELAIIRRRSKGEDFERLNAIAAEQQVVGIVVGLPTNDDHGPNAQAQADTVRRWVEAYAETTRLPIVLWEEALSSLDARALAGKRRKPQEPIDDFAARVILQSYLDALRDGLAPPPDAGDQHP